MSLQQDIFSRSSSQKEVFRRTAGPSAGRIFRHMKRKEGPRTLNIRTIPCPKKCGGTTTTLARHACAKCHFGGWWGQWKEQT